MHSFFCTLRSSIKHQYELPCLANWPKVAVLKHEEIEEDNHAFIIQPSCDKRGNKDHMTGKNPPKRHHLKARKNN